MSTSPHPHPQLSAYVDGALGSVERGTVEAHLASCAGCRSRAAQLSATVRLLGSLPDLTPSRRLTPRVAAPPAWLAPLRTLTTLASGVSVFLFIASALLANLGSLAGTAAAPAAAPVVGLGGAPAASGAPERATLSQPTAAPSGQAAADGAKAQASQSVPPRSDDTAASPAARAASGETDLTVRERTQTPLGPSPWLWLGLAAVTGAIALALQRRLRAA